MSNDQDKCAECKGRGWHVGECHPREECEKCEGTGLAGMALSLALADKQRHEAVKAMRAPAAEPRTETPQPCGRLHVNAQEWDELVDIHRAAVAFLRAFDDYAHIDGRTPSHEVKALMASRNRLEEKLDAWKRSEGIDS